MLLLTQQLQKIQWTCLHLYKTMTSKIGPHVILTDSHALGQTQSCSILCPQCRRRILAAKVLSMAARSADGAVVDAPGAIRISYLESGGELRA